MTYSSAIPQFFEKTVQTMDISFRGKQKRTIEIRYDRLFGVRSIISPERANRGVSFQHEMNIIESGACDFCNPYEQVPENSRYEHRRDDKLIALSFPNLWPTGENHLVTVYSPIGKHKSKPTELSFNDLVALVESEYDLVETYATNGAVAFVDFTNLGALAGASQKHFHSQRKPVPYLPDVLRLEMKNAMQLYKDGRNRNPFDLLIEQELEANERVIYFDDMIYIGAAFSPKTTHEILGIARQDISTILSTDRTTRERMIKPLLGIFHSLRLIKGIKDMNAVIHQAPCEERNAPWFRWHMHIFPRRPRQPPIDQAGEELGWGTYPVEALPEETTAKPLRKWYIDDASEELVLKVDGEIPPPLGKEYNDIKNGI